jgi:hypothetical protein
MNPQLLPATAPDDVPAWQQTVVGHRLALIGVPRQPGRMPRCERRRPRLVVALLDLEQRRERGKVRRPMAQKGAP